MGIEREIWKRKWLKGKSTLRTGCMKRKMLIAISFAIDRHITISLVDRNSKWVPYTCQELFSIFFYETIDNDINWRWCLKFSFVSVGNRIHRISLLKSHKRLLSYETSEFSKRYCLFCKLEGNHDMKLASFAKCRHMIDNILKCLFSQRCFWVIGTVWHSYTRIEKTVEVIDFCDSSDRWSRIIRHCLLMYGDSWRKTSDFTNLGWFWNIWDNHTCIRGKWLEISSLSLSIQGIKGEWWLPRTWNACYDNKFVFWDINRNLLEIMCFRVDDLDFFRHVCFCLRQGIIRIPSQLIHLWVPLHKHWRLILSIWHRRWGARF